MNTDLVKGDQPMNTRHSQNPEPDVSDANLDVGSTFIQIGEPALAVVMRLQTRLPRIKVASPSATLSEGGRGDGLA